MHQSESAVTPHEDWTAFQDKVRRTADYAGYMSLCRVFRRTWKSEVPTPKKRLRLAILGSGNTDFISAPLRLALSTHHVACDIQTAPFNTYAHEALDPASPTSSFDPDVVFLSLSPTHQPVWPETDDTADEVERKVEEVVNYWLNLCRSLHNNTGCEVVIDNFRQLTSRPFGNLASKIPGDRNQFLFRVNDSFAAKAPEYVHISDVAWLASAHGLLKWHDERYWHHAKQAVSFECLVPYVSNISNVVASLFGGTRKVLVLDLDNTLWGGVIGDDGLEGIRLGQGSPEGEAYVELQKYVLELKERGVLLAICSKNELENARLPFQKHPESVLKLDDFVCIEANWDPKPTNLRRIAQRLNLGIDSFVFLDDNPAEREIVRQQTPEVLTVELTDDPADYVRLLDGCGAFEVTSVSQEDGQRSRQYRENAQRTELLDCVDDYETFLESLEQVARVGPFDPERIERITQLINKTNQFNLTTVRMSRSDVEAMMESESSFTLCAELADKFGDNGLISIVFGEWAEQNSMRVDAWLMSCRVLKRGMERLMCNQLVSLARKRGATCIEGKYVPTNRNAMVAAHYSELGFEKIWENPDGSTGWRLGLDDYEEHPVNISLGE